MAIRFRYLAADGREVDVATAEELARRLADGELSEDTLVFDAASDGWAPLRSHEVFFNAIASHSAEDAPTASAEDDPLGLGPIHLTVDEGVHAPSTEDLVADLLRQREDRPAEVHLFPDVQDLPALASVAPLRDVVEETPPSHADGSDHSSGNASRTQAPDVAAVAGGPMEPASTPVAGASRAAGAGSRRYAASRPRPAPRARPTAPPPSMPAARPRAVDHRPGRLLGMGGAVLVGTAVALIGLVLLNDGGRSGSVGPVQAGVGTLGAAEAPAPTGLPARLTATESEALEDMVLGMDSLRVAFEVERVPAVWLEGAYLADAGAHPQVRYFWERYRTYVEQVRAQEAELFRRHLVARLEREGVTGPMISIRLARALRVFESQRPGRETVYSSMLELADASLDFHDLLVEHEQEIAYEPVSQGFSREPVVEAVALSPELNGEMNRMLDRIFAAIEGVYGERIAPREELAGALVRRLSTDG